MLYVNHARVLSDNKCLCTCIIASLFCFSYLKLTWIHKYRYVLFPLLCATIPPYFGFLFLHSSLHTPYIYVLPFSDFHSTKHVTLDGKKCRNVLKKIWKKIWQPYLHWWGISTGNEMKDETKQTKIQEYTFKKSPSHYRTFPWILLYIITHVQNTLK